MDKKTFEELAFQNGIQLGDSPYDPTKLTIDQGTDAAPDDLFSSATYNKIKNHWIGAVATDPENGMIQSIVAGSKLEHYAGDAWEEILQLTRSADVTPQFAGCNLGVGELTTGSINRVAGVLTLEIGGATICSISAVPESDFLIRSTAGCRVTIEAEGTDRLAGIRLIARDSVPADKSWYIDNRGGVDGVPDNSLVFSEPTAGAKCIVFKDGAVANTLVVQTGSIVDIGGGTGELTAGSINRGAGTLSLEIAGTSVIDILATYVNVKQNLFINETVNTFMTKGITVMAGDDEALAFKGADVAHGMTDETETDTWGIIKKGNTGAVAGTLVIQGLTEAGVVGMHIDGYATLDDTNKSTGSVAPVEINAAKKTAATVGSVGANANICVFQNNLSTALLIDEDGDIHSVSGAAPVGFDEYDDIALVNDLKRYLETPKDLKAAFKDFIKYNREALIKTGIISKDNFVSMKGMQGLFLGAISQLGQKIKLLESKKDN